MQLTALDLGARALGLDHARVVGLDPGGDGQSGAGDQQFLVTDQSNQAFGSALSYGKRYALCALIDEVVLSTPWGSKSAWPKQSLVATFHNEVVSGNRMLEVAESLEARPSRSPVSGPCS